MSFYKRIITLHLEQDFSDYLEATQALWRKERIKRLKHNSLRKTLVALQSTEELARKAAKSTRKGYGGSWVLQ